jgi:hypothetical protein
LKSNFHILHRAAKGHGHLKVGFAADRR